MPTAPARKQPIIVKVAFFGLIPPSIRYFLLDGNILYSDENIYIIHVR
jgi:hypothetical protein